MARLAILTDALAFARTYTLSLLDTIPQADWFTMPAGCPSHIAWQIGHLALAEARLVYDRVCCGRSQDGLLPGEFHTLFGRTSIPNPDRRPRNRTSAPILQDKSGVSALVWTPRNDARRTNRPDSPDVGPVAGVVRTE
jgi:hypothetical protein